MVREKRGFDSTVEVTIQANHQTVIDSLTL